MVEQLKVQEKKDDSIFQPKKQKKKKKKFKRVLFWIKLILVSGLIVTSIILLASSALFDIKKIEIYGNKHYNSDIITNAIDVSIGSNGFESIGGSVAGISKLRYLKCEQEILKHFPYIKSATVKYIIPNKVRVDIIERDPLCIVPYLGTNLLIDDEGFVVDTLQESAASGFPKVDGLEFENYEMGQALKIKNPECMEKLILLINTVKNSDKADEVELFNRIGSIDMRSIDRISLTIDSRISVNLGGLQDLDYRISMLKQILLKSIKEDEKGLLDFTTGKNPVFIPEK